MSINSLGDEYDPQAYEVTLQDNFDAAHKEVLRLEAENNRLNKLITKLAHWAQIYSDQRNVPNLELLKVLQEAREAIKP